MRFLALYVRVSGQIRPDTASCRLSFHGYKHTNTYRNVAAVAAAADDDDYDDHSGDRDCLFPRYAGPFLIILIPPVVSAPFTIATAPKLTALCKCT